MLKKVMLKKETSLHGSNSYVCILFDEMKAHQSLVYDKYTAQVVGFTKVWTEVTWNIQWHSWCHGQRCVQFPCSIPICYNWHYWCKVSNMGSNVIWEAIERFALTASPNCIYQRNMLQDPESIHEWRSIHLLFPHLMKTTRNCWSHSQ